MSAFNRLDGRAAVLDRRDLVPALLQQRRDELAVHGVVLGDEDRAAPGAARAPSAGDGPARAASTRRTRGQRIQQVGVLDRLGQVRVDARLAAARAIAVTWPIEVSITIGVSAQLSCPAGSGEPA